ncbi:MAG: Holliday junction branch migration protein RuvA [Lachnospiraceae bacterium]|uniref:Holliday junction branch migration complex subunit RuvA n=1 Tax=Candidatus Weimeria bifida TaxID=2599074 RepID=A0A6N7IYQ0_9FIRM|nr:Holliday junction branch migration protein RuvA [Candidatus Weimeria bifida]RRF95366.1 MAG: Holliday junction branch migration protein RuvA [Lachnospiraceae bacterium]
MISFIDGYIESVSDGTVVVDHDGMGFEMQMSGNSISRLPIDHSRIRVYTLLGFNENTGFSLYGFLDSEERDFFKMLTGVSKVGPKAAMGVLSVLTPDELRLSIIAGDKKSIARAPGVGTKMAERIILELKDKIDASDLSSEKDTDEGGVASSVSSVKNDALVALTGMGFSGSDVLSAMKKIDGADDLSLEDLLSQTLRVLGSN